MATAKLSEMVTNLGRGLAAPTDDAIGDGDLIGKFLLSRDEDAFAQLVRRHGPLVFGVCRRVTGNHHLAEDAFQAVFVVLAAKAESVRPRSALPGWLCSVAYRTALRARTMADRRHRREAPVETLPEPADESAPTAPSTDLVEALDEEIARLPDTLRTAVLLCEIQGKSRKDAASQLGIAEGTLSSRLAAARKALAGRLKSRGILLSVAGLTVALAQVGSAAVPPNLTAQAVVAALTPGLTPAPVAALSNGVLHLMFAHKLKTVSLAVAIITTAVIGGWLFASGQPPATPPATAPLPVDKPQPTLAVRGADPKPLPKGPNKILFYRDGHLTLIDPTGKNDQKVSTDKMSSLPGHAKLSPDGGLVAILFQAGKPEAPAPGATQGITPRRKLYVRELGGTESMKDLDAQCQSFSWSPDGAKIVCSEFLDTTEQSPNQNATHFTVDVKTGAKTALKVPADHIITGWSQDGKYFLTMAGDATTNPPHVGLFLVNLDGTIHKALTPPEKLCVDGCLSADGKRLLYKAVTLPTKEMPGEPKVELSLLDLTTNTSAPVADLPINGELQGYCLSPDGKQIAYGWREKHQGKPEDLIQKETESFLVVCDANGKNPKTISSAKANGQWVVTIMAPDWR